jgi:uncharacterized membrane protein YjfL (UPF0719 family)
MSNLLFVFLQVLSFERGILGTVVYSLLGLVICVLGFKVVDWLIPGHLARQIAEEKNVAAALVAAALLLGICIIIAAAIVG